MKTTNENVTIMVVDDTPANLRLLEEMLRKEGYQILEFPSAETALEALERNHPNLILLDIMMPRMNGFQMCAKLKANERFADIPVMFISALDDTDIKVKAFTEGGVDYITKPFKEPEVLARVKTHLNLQRQNKMIEKQKEHIKKDYEKLQKLENMRDNLVHMFIHDMRSPLTVLLGHLQILEIELKQDGNEEYIAVFKVLNKVGENIKNMINAILDVSRLESDKMPIEITNCDIQNIISQTVSLYKEIEDQSIILEPTQKEIKVKCDSEITSRIMENLISNGIKYSERNSDITIAIKPDEKAVKVSITDQGDGIPKEHQKDIFEKFGQVMGEGENNKQYSTGLGLYFCKLAVEAQNGTIGVDSEVGKGSTFWFTLPRAEE